MTIDAERRRIARALHDGLQTRLIRLAMRADLLRADSGLTDDAQTTRQPRCTRNCVTRSPSCAASSMG